MKSLTQYVNEGKGTEIKVALPKEQWDIMSKAFHKGDLDAYLDKLTNAEKNQWMSAMENLLRALREE